MASSCYYPHYQDLLWQMPLTSMAISSGTVYYNSAGELCAYREQVLKERLELDEYDELDQQDESEEANGR